MTKSQSAIAASVKTASRGNAAFVFASRADQLPQTSEELTQRITSTKYSKFGCTACSTEMHSRADTVPFCITCGAGDGHVHQVEADAKPAVTAETNLVAMTCSLCNTATVVEDVVATAITAAAGSKPHPVHCSCCGNAMVAAAAQEQDGEPAVMKEQNIGQPALVTPDKVEANEGDVSLDMEAGDGASFGEDDGDDDMDLDSLASLDDVPEADGDEFGLAEDGDEGLEASSSNTLITPGGPTGIPEFSRPVPEDGSSAATTDDAFSLELEPLVADAEEMAPVTDIEDAPGSGAGFDEAPVLSVESEEAGDPLMDTLEMDDTDVAVAFVKANTRLVVMKGHVAIASMSVRSKTPNAKLINSDALPAATQAAIQSAGLREGLKSIGFSFVRVPVSAASKTAVARKVQEVTAATAKTEVEKQKVFASSFALAAAGLNRGQWKGVVNPLRAALETELARVGVESPRRVVSSVFNAAGMEYAEALLSTADRLAKMSASARKELSEVLNMTAAVSPADEHDDEADEAIDATPIESRMSKAGSKVTSAALLRPNINASAGATSAAAAVLTGKAPLSFSF